MDEQVRKIIESWGLKPESKTEKTEIQGVKGDMVKPNSPLQPAPEAEKGVKGVKGSTPTGGDNSDEKTGEKVVFENDDPDGTDDELATSSKKDESEDDEEINLDEIDFSGLIEEDDEIDPRGGQL